MNSRRAVVPALPHRFVLSRSRVLPCSLALLCFAATPALHSQEAPPLAGAPVTGAPLAGIPRLSALSKMPVREITVFKDGHAFVLHEGSMPVDTAGNVNLDYLPTPVVGTFWPYAADNNAKLTSVVASSRRLMVDRTTLSIRELLEANIGADAVINEGNGKTYPAKILDVPSRTSAEMEDNGPLPISANRDPYNQNPVPVPGQPPLPQKGSVILLQTKEGVKALPIDRVLDVSFPKTPSTKLGNEEYRNLLTLKLDWKNRATARMANVGMVYLQKGVRWIPNYRIVLDGKGQATVRLQASLINELTDLNNVTANLVIGVPSFKFQDTTDPISLQDTMARLSGYFQTNSRTGNAFSNAMATQARSAYSVARTEDTPVNLGPDIVEGNQSEDMFVFTVKNVSLRKGERMVFPITEYTLPYKDVYTLDLPFTPPGDLVRNYNSSQQAELAQLLAAPKVMHKIRLTNKNTQPLTTAPVLIESNGRLMAQSLMTYTAAGGNTDIEVTDAVDITATKTEEETKRTLNAVKWHDDNYTRVDLDGKIRLCSYKNEPVNLEITRHVVGLVDTVDNKGVSKTLNVLEDSNLAYPAWWNWYDSGSGWQSLNGLSQVSWTVTLQPKKEAVLGYKYHTFWR